MRTRQWTAALVTAVLIFVGAIQMAHAQDHKCKVVGWEVFSNNTPGGKGQPKSEGLTGERTPWSITTGVPGTGVDTFVVRYYCCKECRDADLKKNKDDKGKGDGKGKGDSKKDPPKKDDKKEPPKGGKPPEGPNVPTFDPRFYELDENGKVVPKKPKEGDQKTFESEHQHCDMPAKFECSEHFEWWKKNHDHRTQPSEDSQGRLILSGAVVSGEEATLTAVGPTGAVLSGVVIELPNGQKATTDKNGRAKYLVPAGITTLLLTMSGSGSGAKQFVMTPEQAAGSNWSPFSAQPHAVFGGQTQSIPLDGVHGSYQAMLDGKPVELMASSPTEAVVAIPNGLPPGIHTLSVVSDGHVVAGQVLQFCQLVAEPPKTFVKGQSGAYKISVVGSSSPVRVRLENHSPDVVQVQPGKKLELMASSTWSAQTWIKQSMNLTLKALKVGPIRIMATPLPSLNRWGG